MLQQMGASGEPSTQDLLRLMASAAGLLGGRALNANERNAVIRLLECVEQATPPGGQEERKVNQPQRSYSFEPPRVNCFGGSQNCLLGSCYHRRNRSAWQTPVVEKSAASLASIPRPVLRLFAPPRSAMLRVRARCSCLTAAGDSRPRPPASIAGAAFARGASSRASTRARSGCAAPPT